ncbi:hypothetical protein CONLIGDRAFT_303042 [Coniochaeta ligniaria NRRL 30616]|uniref:Uncharacterized protein n=1 Tax=Coniochaeta ligniaria NRRL 30616 TaxID=1408157 RepID=A0A1J7IV30_9PEZI|nr:hypothetical protein CONLIGDRAFT_303042 [Coniochaeta ligniaria NRRL 30616]
MASSSSQELSPTYTSLSHLPCIRALHLNTTTCTAVLDLARAVKHDQEDSGQHVLLAAQTLAEAKTWSPILLSSSAWAKAAALRTQLISESDALIATVSAVNPSALYLYEKALVVQLHAGVAALKSFLTMERDCGLVIPLFEGNDLLVTAWDETRGDDVYRLQLADGKAFVMSGSSKLRVSGGDPLVAVVFCLAAGGGGEVSV